MNKKIDDVSDISDYYNRDPDSEQERLNRHQLEYDLTWRYLDKYLPPPGSSILEVGTATGGYTVALAQRGYKITAVDMSEVLLDRCRENLAAQGLADRARLVLSDARDLGKVTQMDFDAALLMGPLYHLVEDSDRLTAIREVHDRLKPAATLFSAFISRYGIMGDVLKSTPWWIEEQTDVRSILERGRDLEDYPKGGFRGYFATVGEVAPLHEAIGFETLVVAGVEPAIASDDESYNQLEGRQRELWLDLFHELSTEPSILGASRHLLYIGRKME